MSQVTMENRKLDKKKWMPMMMMMMMVKVGNKEKQGILGNLVSLLGHLVSMKLRCETKLFRKYEFPCVSDKFCPFKSVKLRVTYFELLCNNAFLSPYSTTH